MLSREVSFSLQIDANQPRGIEPPLFNANPMPTDIQIQMWLDTVSSSSIEEAKGIGEKLKISGVRRFFPCKRHFFH